MIASSMARVSVIGDHPIGPHTNGDGTTTPRYGEHRTPLASGPGAAVAWGSAPGCGAPPDGAPERAHGADRAAVAFLQVSYEVIGRLGRGGMGVVDLARDGEGRKVALKRLPLHGSAAEIARARQRLLREADALSRLDHRHIVRLLDVVDEGDEVVLVMPFLPGGDLAERVGRHGPASTDEVDRLAGRLLRALAAAHRAGVVHRDIKPANVLYDAHGEPCLADFGVAHASDQTEGLTADGTVVGTPTFMAPEQARGEPAGPACDVFSLGATLLFAATGSGPYGHGDPGLIMVRAARGKVDRVPADLPVHLRRLFRAMLDPRPERRPSAAALVGGLDGTAVGRRAIGRVRRRSLRGSPSGPPLAVGAVAGIGVVLVALAAVLTGNRGGDDEATDRAPLTATECVDLPYQPCDQAEPAPFTDGTRCIDGHDDYDGDPANGCEAAPDQMDGAPLVDTLEATIIPRDDVDEFPIEVEDRPQLLCDGILEVTLGAPDGMTLHVEVRDGDEVLGDATASDGRAGVVEIREPSCGGDDSTTLTTRVRPIGSERVADPYVLTRSGSF